MKRTKRLLAIILVIALLAGASSVLAASFTVPTRPLSTNDGVIKVVAARAGQIAPLILGADLAASTNLGGADGAFVGANAILGVFGSDINAKPDPWLYNYFYNLSQPDDNKVGNATISVSQPDGTQPTVETMTAEMIHRPHMILTQLEGTGDPSPTRFQGYLNIIETFAENTDSNPANDYAPSFFTCSTSALVIQTQNLIELAKAINTVTAAKNLKTRYGNPYDTAANYDKYVWGYYFYIQEMLESGAIIKKSSAVLSSTADSGASWTLAAPTAGTGRPTSRLVEYVRDNTDLLNETLGGNTATLAEVLACDVVIATTNNNSKVMGDTLRAAAAAAGILEADLPVIIDTLPTCLYGMVMQTHENALGIPLIQSIIYGEELGINPVYAAAYFYENFFHITDNTALQETVNALMASATLPTGVTTSIAQYDPSDVEAIIAQGVAYGTGMPRHNDTTPWAPDTTVPLGAGKEANPDVFYPPYEPETDDKDKDESSEDEGGESIVFADVKETDWFYDAVKFMSDKGLMTGTTADSFDPMLPTSRAMLATILYRMEKEPEVTGSSMFDDVMEGVWYADAVIWAAENGIVTGYNDMTFGGDDNLTREQIAVMLYRYAKFKELDVSLKTDLGKFADAANVSDWALDAMTWAVAVGLINGRSDTELAPKDIAMRAEVAMMLMRYMETVGKQ